MMGIINIDEDIHSSIRKASALYCRSINAQAVFWIKIGMLAEMNPTLSFHELMTKQLSSADISSTTISAEVTHGQEC